MGDAGQRLAAEPVRADLQQVLESRQLTSGKAFTDQRQVLPTDTCRPTPHTHIHIQWSTDSTDSRPETSIGEFTVRTMAGTSNAPGCFRFAKLPGLQYDKDNPRRLGCTIRRQTPYCTASGFLGQTFDWVNLANCHKDRLFLSSKGFWCPWCTILFRYPTRKIQRAEIRRVSRWSIFLKRLLVECVGALGI